MMKTGHSKKITTIAMILSIILILSAAGLAAFHYISQGRAADRAMTISDEMKRLMPDMKYGTTDAAGDIEMPVMEIDGEDFIGILEVPEYDKLLPVRSEWNKNKANTLPCRYKGSLYDKSLIIGASAAAGQFDITGVISGGDEVSVTDVNGAKYMYIITDIHKTKDVSAENLQAQKADLLLFVKDAYGTEYMMISCSSR